MNIKLSSGLIYGVGIIALTVLVLHGFTQALLAACVTAIASWPLFERFSARWSRHIGSMGTSLLFAGLIVVFVLAPLIVAFGALFTETHTLLVELAAADQTGVGAPGWLLNVPLLGPFVHDRWQDEFAHPGALSMWTQRTDPTALLAWAQALGRFMGRHVFIVVFTILLLVFAYQKGATLAEDFRRVLRDCVGQQADRYIDVATRTVRASVNSMLIVGLFDGLAAAGVYALAGVPHAGLWAAITGALAIVPFLGYVAVIAVALQLAMKGATTMAALALAMGCVVLICGDKILRPAIADNGIRLGFVWVLMGCLGGFEVLGLVGLVVGPVALGLARELWAQRVRDVAAADGAGCTGVRPDPSQKMD